MKYLTVFLILFSLCYCHILPDINQMYIENSGNHKETIENQHQHQDQHQHQHHHQHQHKQQHIHGNNSEHIIERRLTYTTKIQERELPSLPTLDLSELSYTYEIEVNSNSENNPYIHESNLPQNLVFIIVGGILLLMFLAFVSYWIVSYSMSYFTAKNHSEKYYYNTPFTFGESSSSSSSSSLDRKSKAGSIYSNFDNLSQVTLNQPLGRSYRNAALDNNRGSMFISPVNEMMMANKLDDNYDSSMTLNNSSTLSLLEGLDVNQSNLNDNMNKLDENGKRMTRVPSLYLEELLDD